MNERIKELAEQATETVRCGLNGTSTAESFNRKKFAELIVRECYEWAKENGGLGAEYDYDALKEYFGVE